ncbi:hypothetical protein [Methylobacterium sp. WL8]|nr:hypothetical protein [Methylobacterium sp. WL8]
MRIGWGPVRLLHYRQKLRSMPIDRASETGFTKKKSHLGGQAAKP